MVRRCMLAMLVLAVPSVAWAQLGSEKYLPAGSQLYFRWDGFDGHRADFDKTACGKLLKGDTGKFLAGLGTYVGQQIDGVVGAFDPQAAQVVKDVGKIIEGVGKNGIVLGVELKSIKPPDVQATLLLPKSGDGPLLPLVKKAFDMSGMDVKETKVGKRTVFHVEPEKDLHIGWWNEAGDAVLVIGTNSPVKIAKGSVKTLAGNARYKEVAGFKEFPTWCRGYLDFAGLTKVVKTISPDVSKLIDELGLDGIRSLTFYSGFDGPAERGLVELSTPGPRKGLLKLASQKTVKLADLPPLPTDLTSFSISSIDLAGMYDVLVPTVEAAVKIFAPNEADKVKEFIKQAEGIVGVKFRDDLLASLGDTMVNYNSPGDGPLGLGAVTMITVKDAKKLRASLEGVVKGLNNLPGVNVALKKKIYREVELLEVHIGGPFNFTVPTFAIHKGWLIVSNYPQPVKGHILRDAGELPAYDVQKKLGKYLAPFPKEFVSLSMSDPRPTVKFLLSLTPTAMTLLNGVTSQFLPAAPQFDVTLIPHAQEVTRHLFPNISVTTDDGKKVRLESRSSLGLPF